MWEATVSKSIHRNVTKVTFETSELTNSPAPDQAKHPGIFHLAPVEETEQSSSDSCLESVCGCFLGAQHPLEMLEICSIPSEEPWEWLSLPRCGYSVEIPLYRDQDPELLKCKLIRQPMEFRTATWQMPEALCFQEPSWSRSWRQHSPPSHVVLSCCIQAKSLTRVNPWPTTQQQLKHQSVTNIILHYFIQNPKTATRNKFNSNANQNQGSISMRCLNLDSAIVPKRHNNIYCEEKSFDYYLLEFWCHFEGEDFEEVTHGS